MVERIGEGGGFGEGEAEGLALLEEEETVEVGRSVLTVAGAGLGGLGEQPLAFVVANGFHTDPGSPGQFGDLHETDVSACRTFCSRDRGSWRCHRGRRYSRSRICCS